MHFSELNSAAATARPAEGKRPSKLVDQCCSNPNQARHYNSSSRGQRHSEVVGPAELKQHEKIAFEQWLASGSALLEAALEGSALEKGNAV